ncbi:Heme/hemopexin utilization protein C precursor [Leminorella richardii]|uniref:Heme/hemopexin utilization protein C n=1 Tax=Leminorella richardii TaxID=158841 RepID=A0A2X4XWJ1_9GAMM|nr:TonB-dependent hemoglobin/transferrin/lactoferrin family receptor [Leminorella richardii]SQI44425.1 Heme/hemopexin utilization protein C precursor [Leminorella richardii]
MLRLSPLCITLACALPLMANAQSQNATASNDVMTVVATGNDRNAFEAPMMVTVVDPSAPENLAVNSAADLVRSIPGITISGIGRSNGQDITMRGYDKRGILMLVDGIRQGTDTGHLNGIFLDPALIKRVEVVRGPSAQLYGSGALGGVIAFETVDAKDLLRDGEQGGVRLFGSGATLDHSQAMGITAFGRTDSLDGIFSANFRDKGNLRLSNGETAPNDENIGSFLAKGTWYMTDAQSLTANLRYYNNDAREPKNPQNAQPGTTSTDLMTDRTTESKDAQLVYRLNPSDLDWLDATTRVYYSETNIDSTPEGKREEGRKQKTEGIKVENRSRLFQQSAVPNHLTYGAETYKQKQNPSGATTSFPEAEIKFASGWLQDELTLRDLPVSFIAGVRYDNYKAESSGYSDIDADQWSPKVAMSIFPTQWLSLFASYSEAFRAPTMGEMYNDSLHFSMGPNMNNYWKPNPNLKPETNATTEAGFGLRFDNLLMADDGLKFKASYFNTKAEDYIDTTVNMKVGYRPGVGVICSPCETTSVNIPRAKIWGWDLMMDYQTNYFDMSVAYNRTSGKNEDTGAWLSTVSPDTVSTKLNVPLGNTNAAVGWIGVFADRIKDAPTPQSGYATHDFYVSYKPDLFKDRMTTSVVISNAFDKEYYTPNGVLQDGRNVKLFASYQF